MLNHQTFILMCNICTDDRRRQISGCGLFWRNTWTEGVFWFFSTADPNTLFRSNSLASKAMEQFMKVCADLHRIVFSVCECSQSRGLVCFSGRRDAVSTPGSEAHYQPHLWGKEIRRVGSMQDRPQPLQVCTNTHTHNSSSFMQHIISWNSHDRVK